MREIKFRGKRIDNGEWVYGFYNFTIFDDGSDELMAVIRQHIIADENGYVWSIDKNTVGQYTGLKDDDEKEIYEGDNVSCVGGEHYLGTWEFSAVIKIKDLRDLDELVHVNWDMVKVIGTIYDL